MLLIFRSKSLTFVYCSYLGSTFGGQDVCISYNIALYVPFGILFNLQVEKDMKCLLINWKS